MVLFDKWLGPLRIRFEWDTGPDYSMRLGEIRFTFPRGIVFKMATTLPDDRVLPFVSPSSGTDSKGNPTKLKGTVKVTTSDAAIATITQPNPRTPGDPNSGIVVPVGPLGTVQVRFEDDDDSSSPLIVLADVEVVGGDTVTMNPPVFGPVETPLAPSA